MTETDRLLNKEEAAAMLHVPPQTLYTWRKRGKGPQAARYGKRLVWRESDVRRYIDEAFAKAGAA